MVKKLSREKGKSQHHLETIIDIISIIGVVYHGNSSGKWVIIVSRQETSILRLLAENAQDLIYRVRLKPEQEFEYVSPSATKITGYTPADHYQDPALGYKLVHPDDRQLLEAAARGDVSFEDPLVLRWVKKDGTIIWTEQRNTPVTDDAGELIAIEGMARDITAQKLAEDKVDQYVSELEAQRLKIEELYHELNEELNKAREMHKRSMLDLMPQVEGVNLAAYYQSARKVGGDFYNVIQKDHLLVFYLSDVTGHGLEGAIVSLFVKHTLNDYLALSPDSEITPANMLKYLAQQFAGENFPDDYFVCIFLAVLDLNTKELTYTGAGFHTPPLLCHREDGIRELVSEGLPISLAYASDLLDYRENTVTLKPESIVLCYTDGLPEQTIGRLKYHNRLRGVVSRCLGQSPEAVIDRIMLDFYAFNNQMCQCDDDITCLALQVTD